jgi:DNA-binding CsgD family transcriptional regulator
MTYDLSVRIPGKLPVDLRFCVWQAVRSPAGEGNPAVSEASLLWERDEARAAITALLERAVAGDPATLFIAGDPGLGKSSLLDYAHQAARQRGFTVAAARGDPMETALPFGLLAQVFAGLADEQLGGRDGQELGTAAAQGAHFYAALRWLRDLGASPALVTLDDLHWSDPDSLALLSFLCRRLGGLKVAVVATLRLWPAGAEALANRLASSSHARIERLMPLSEQSSGELLAARLGSPMMPDEANRAWQISAGNPLLLEQLAAVASRGEHIPGQATAGTDAKLLLSRFADLPVPGMRLVQAAAVLGARFRTGIGLRLAQLTDAEADLALDALDRTGLVVPAGAGSLRFVHPLYQQVVYEDVGGVQRERLHGLAFSLLADHGMDAEAAEHALLAGLAHDPAAVGLLERVGTSALRGGAFETGLLVLEATAELAGRSASPQLLIQLADALIYARRPEDAARVSERALSSPDLTPDTRAAALRVMARAFVNTGAYESAAERLQESIDLTASTEPEDTVRTVVFYGWASWYCAGPARAHEVLSRIQRSTRPELRDSRGRLAAALALTALESGHPHGLDSARDAAAMIAADPALTAEDLATAWGALITYASAAKYIERLDDSEHFFGTALRAAERLGAVGDEASALVACADTLIRQLRISDASRYLERAQALSDLVPLAGPFAATGMAITQLLAGHLDESLACIRAAEPVVAAVGAWSAQLWLGYIKGWHLLAAGEYGQASDVYAAAENLTRQVGLDEPCAVPWASHAIAAHLGCGRTDDALRILRWVSDSTLRLPCRWPYLVTLTGNARLAAAAGADREADEFYGAALAVHDEIDLPLEHVQTLLEYGRFLRRSGHPARARPLLARASLLASDGGAHWLAGLAAAELRVAGGRLRRRPEPGALTPQEARVAELAVARLSNKEIADRLYVAVKTVETHLERIYAKLGIHSRAELRTVGIPDKREPAASNN